MKKIFFSTLVILALAGCTAQKDNQQIVKVFNEQLKYSNINIKIPETELLKSFEDFFLPEDSHWEADEVYPFKYICKNGKSSIKAEIVTGRTAIICGEQYVIQEFHPALGYPIYGPYKLEN